MPRARHNERRRAAPSSIAPAAAKKRIAGGTEAAAMSVRWTRSSMAMMNAPAPITGGMI
jgi:hypothetical protein